MIYFVSLPPRLTKESVEVLKWEQSFLDLEIIQSQFVGAGYGLATNATKYFAKNDIIAKFIGRFVVMPKSSTDEVFNPQFLGNHERIIELGPLMQPIVYPNHATLDDFEKVSVIIWLFMSLLQLL